MVFRLNKPYFFFALAGNLQILPQKLFFSKIVSDLFIYELAIYNFAIGKL
jgi:hypothetical protein